MPAVAPISLPSLVAVFDTDREGHRALMAIPRTAPAAPERRRNLSTNEAADYLNVSVRTLRNYVAAGQVRARRVGPKLLRFNADDLDKFLKS